jgi:hypothetical protein
MKDVPMNVRATPLRLIKALFTAAMIVTYGGLVAGIVGLLNAKSVALVALAASVVGALAALAFSVLWNWEWRRSHPRLMVTRGQ